MRQLRGYYRHQLRTLIYVTFEEGGTGVVRNLNRTGLGVETARLRPQQRVRLRFELPSPPLMIEAHGQVSWATSSGRCGIRFVNLPVVMNRKINEWIFANLLDEAARQDAHRRSILGISPDPSQLRPEASVEDRPVEDPLAENNERSVLPSQPLNIRLEPDSSKSGMAVIPFRPPAPQPRVPRYSTQLDWLSQPLSDRTLAWLVDALVVFAALLIFALIFLSIAREVPPLPLALGTATMAAVFVASAYRALFAVLGGPSLGARLAQSTTASEAVEEEQAS